MGWVGTRYVYREEWGHTSHLSPPPPSPLSLSLSFPPRSSSQCHLRKRGDGWGQEGFRVEGHGGQHALRRGPHAEVLNRLSPRLPGHGHLHGTLVVLLQRVQGALLVRHLGPAGFRIAAAHDEDGVCRNRRRT